VRKYLRVTAVLRPYGLPDLPALYRICLLTGDAGEDASALYADPDLLGHVYVGPYLALEPALAVVVADRAGVAGYAIGTADTAAFDERAEREWWPLVRERYPAPDGEPVTADERLARLVHDLPRASEDVLRRYPGHLHIDLLPRVQGIGAGRRAMERLLDLLAATGARGVHLGVNPRNLRARAFYAHIGFVELGAAGVMGKAL
jgi:GNAT superfamily N-acetyltransferase